MISEMPPKMQKIIKSDLSPYAKCYSFLKEGILTGYFKRGQRIVERDLIALLSVSRTPLREALRRLENETLIEHSPNKGCTVVGFSGRDIAEIYEVRQALERFMIQTAARSVSREELLSLRENVVRQKENPNESGKYWSFHVELLRLTKHRWLNTVLAPLEEYIERFHVLSYLRKGRAEQAYAEHLEIIDALLDADADKAEKLMIDHLDRSYEAYKDIFTFL